MVMICILTVGMWSHGLWDTNLLYSYTFGLIYICRCMVGNEMVDWIMQQCTLVHSRTQASGMWQALLEEGVIVHGERE